MRAARIALLIAAVLAVLPAREGLAMESKASGTMAGQFLKFGVGARAMSMGEAYSAVADDASALYWNPAGLTRIENRSATFMHASGIGSSFFEYGAYGQNRGKYGAMGASFQYLSPGSVTETDDTTGAEVGTLTPYDLALSVGYAYRLEELEAVPELNGFAFGLTVKYIRSKLIDSDQTAAVDLGVLTTGYMDGDLRFAATLTNLGGSLKFDEKSAHLPLTFRLGWCYRIAAPWSLAMDLAFPNDSDPHVGLGTEYLYPVKGGWTLAGRAGFNSRTIGDVSGFTGASFGLGLAYDKLSVDYGFVPFGSLGQIHRASVSARF